MNVRFMPRVLLAVVAFSSTAVAIDEPTYKNIAIETTTLPFPIVEVPFLRFKEDFPKRFPGAAVNRLSYRVKNEDTGAFLVDYVFFKVEFNDKGKNLQAKFSYLTIGGATLKLLVSMGERINVNEIPVAVAETLKKKYKSKVTEAEKWSSDEGTVRYLVVLTAGNERRLATVTEAGEIVE